MDTNGDILVEVRLDEPTLLRGLNRYWLRRYSANTAVKVVMLIFAVILPFSTLDRWVMLVFYAVFAVSLVHYVTVYAAFRRRSLQIHRERGDPLITYHFRDDGVRITSAGDTADLPWAAFTGLWRFDDMWILLQERVVIHILPTAVLSAEARDMIARHVD